LEGPAASEEASQHPVLFDTLEYRKQNPERELFPKCLRGGQAAIPPSGSESGLTGRWTTGRHDEISIAGWKNQRSVHPEARDGESPREEKSHESQDADSTGEIRWRTSQPTGGGNP